jgi:hypothetical protein
MDNNLIARMEVLILRWQGMEQNALTAPANVAYAELAHDTWVALSQAAAALAALRGAEDAPASDKWQKAALRLGEELASSSGPTGYYAFTPEQWLQWALGEARASASPAPSVCPACGNTRPAPNVCPTCEHVESLGSTAPASPEVRRHAERWEPKRTAPWVMGSGRVLRLLHESELSNVPSGTVLTYVDGSTGVVGTDAIDGDTRGGFLACGVFVDIQAAPSPALEQGERATLEALVRVMRRALDYRGYGGWTSNRMVAGWAYALDRALKGGR